MTEITAITPVLSAVHRAYLNEHAIADAVITAAGIFSAGDEIIFPWADGDQRTLQRRYWPEPEGGLGDAPKYLWEAGHPLHLWEHRPAGTADSPVIIAEGTKQSLAVVGYAPGEYAVYGMPGCDIGLVSRLQRAGLDRFAGHPVIIMLDADAADNLNVYEGGEKLAELLDLEGAGAVTFTRLPAQGTDGIDDFLAATPESRRAEVLAKLLTRAAAKPAERKPVRRKTGDQLPDTGGLPQVIVNKNRREVIREILGHMQQRWNGSQLFCYGGVLTRLRGTETEPLDRDSFARWMCEAVATYTYKPPTAMSAGTYQAAWPEQQTIGAMLASGEEFAPLAGVSRAPFIRPDGSVCFKNGYDWNPETGTGSQVMLVTGNSGMDRLGQNGELENPSREQAAAAARYLLDTWLGDMPWRDESSRANTLALILTPFIRGIVPLAPLAVISGLQPGVGKGLLADCIQLMAAGEASPPMPWSEVDDEENRKQITSAFRGGASLIWFDEAHRIESHALSRAITSLTYADRILGVSKMAAFPNRITWLATGNRVEPSTDMSRRSYLIHLHPDVPDPQDRPESDFAIPELRGWTAVNRPELVTAALTVIRAWYAAGRPAFPRGSLMGSFEAWDKMMSGILGWAGVPGFLASLSADRAERDTSGGYWSDHLAWLLSQFGGQEFTALDVRSRAVAAAGNWDAPPRLDEPDIRGWTRNLGAAYARNQDRWFGSLRITKAGTGHGTKVRWRIQERDQDLDTLIHPIHPIHPGVSETVADLGGRDRMDSGAPENVVLGQPDQLNGAGGVADLDTASDLGISKPNTAGPGRDGLDGLDRSLLPPPTRNAPAHTRAHAHCARVGGAEIHPNHPIHPDPPSGFPVGFDLETGTSDQLFTYRPHDETGYVRLAGLTGPSGATAIVTVPELMMMLNEAGVIYGHNILGFDGLALAWHHGADWDAFASKARDTELIARQAFPPRSRESGSSEDKLGLDAVAALLGLPGKTDDLKRLKVKHGGYDKIPPDDPEYRAYLDGDLHATRAVAGALLRHYDTDPYLPREHAVAAINGRMSLNGFGVDQDLLQTRLEAGEARKQSALEFLHDGWGLPLSRTVLRGRGAARHPEEEFFKSPLSTDEGRAWLEAQWARYQVPDPPRTGTGKLALGAEDLKPLLADPRSSEDLVAMLKLMAIVTGTRTVYQTAADHLAADGRVHPFVSMRQASGRSSTTQPGLTVFGKHGGRHVERDIFVADPGFVLVSFDLSQVDMRAVAAHCQDPAYLALFAPGRDVHAEIAVRVFGDPHGGHCPKGCEVRQSAKARGHGWNYGMGPERMVRDGVDPANAYGFDNGMREQFPQLCAWREGIREMGRAGLILDNGFGRRMLADPARAYTVAPALMGQGTAADLLKMCMLRTPREFDKYRVVAVHDDQVFQFPEKDWEEMAREVVRAMTFDWAPPGKAMTVPIECDVSGPGRTWGEISAG